MNTTFIMPKQIFRGLGSIENIKKVQGTKAIIVTGGNSTKSNGTLDKLESYLDASSIEYKTISGIGADPTLEEVKEGAKTMSIFEPDIIIGVGGCSAIDAAKAMWVFYEHPKTSFETIISPFSVPTMRNKAKFIAIPTTSGTGTEITGLAVITKGKIIVSHELTPDIAIIDGSLCATMPKDVTANTGMDALVHAIEAYTSNISDPISEALAKDAVRMIFESLPIVIENPNDLTHRQKMHDASCMAGMAFTNVWLGIVHSMAHQIGGTFGIEHGCANAILMPNVIRYNSKEVDYTELAKIIGKKNTKQFIEAIEDLRSIVGIPSTFKECGIDATEFKKALTKMSKASMEDPCTLFNKRSTTVLEIKKLYRACYEGKKVKF
ncbi:MAG: iron-containing alcohol dehydrogenase [Clostridia bacterium]